MWRRQLAVFSVVLFLAGCGYVGPVVPPSPKIPVAVSDLSAVERGNQILISFTAPTRTTDGLFIKRFSEIELLVGPSPVPFDLDRWSTAAQPYAIPLPGDFDSDDPKPVTLGTKIPAADMLGKRLAIAVRTAAKGDHTSAWSNVVRLEVVEPLTPPEVQASDTAQGIKLSWAAQRPGLHYNVYRQGSPDKASVEVGTAENNEFVDTTSQFGVEYTYSVVAATGSAESVPSSPVVHTAVDKFAPSVPGSIAALAAINTIEVSWERSPEPDLKGYRVFRSVNGGPFEQQGDLVSLPSYTDRSVEHGKTYRYAISALDQANNESARSEVAEASFQ